MTITAQTPAETQVGGTCELRLREEVPEAPREQPPSRLAVGEPTNVPGADMAAALEPRAANAGRDGAHGKLGGINDAAKESFEARAGEFFVLTEPAGSGKSTNISLLTNRLTDGSASTIVLNERDLAQMSGRELFDVNRADMGMVPQLLTSVSSLHDARQCFRTGTHREVGVGAARENLRRIGIGRSCCLSRSISA